MPVPLALPPPPVEVHLEADPALVDQAYSPPRGSPRYRSRGTRPATIDSIVSETYPIRVHWSQAGDRGRAVEVMGWAELSWAVQVDELGFREPVLPDDTHGPELDIYLSDLPGNEGWTWYEPVDVVTGDGYMGATVYIELARELPMSWYASYVSHEFNHALQNATDFTEESTTVREASSVAAQLWTVGHDDAYWDWDVPDFQALPWVPVLVGDGWWLWDYMEIWSFYEYGAALWMIHLDEVHGDGDGSMGPRLWEAMAAETWSGEPDVAEGLQTVTGLDLGGALCSIARSRVLVGELWDDRGLADAEAWGEEQMVPMAAELALDDLPTDVAPDPAPAVTGQAFFDVALDGRDGDLEVRVESEDELGSALLVLWWGDDGSVGEEVGSDQVVLPTEGVERVIVALTNLGPPGWDAEDYAWDGGDQVVHFEYWEPDTYPGDEEEDPTSCGCVGAGAATGWWALPLGLILARRRRGGGDSSGRR